jgi:hypothetical protein
MESSSVLILDLLLPLNEGQSVIGIAIFVVNLLALGITLDY